MTEAPPLFLASCSPRRVELLAQIGVAFAQRDVEVDERIAGGETAAGYVQRLARDKALAGAAGLPPGAAVLAADTAVVVGGRILGKPADEADALQMLDRLSGREHRVLTGVALARDGCRVRVNESRVRMRVIPARERAAYVATGEPLDKAGAYAIQGLGAVFVEHLEGSYSGVMGLPLFETAELLRSAGVAVPG